MRKLNGTIARLLRTLTLALSITLAGNCLTFAFPGSHQEPVTSRKGGGKPELVIQTGHFSLINSIALSHDEKILASGSGDNSVKLWDVDTGTQVRSLVGHTSYVMSVAFSPAGVILASGGFDNTVRLWNGETGAEIRLFKGHTGGLFSVAFSREGRTLASGGFDRSVKLWNVETGELIRSFEGHTKMIFSLQFSPDLRTLASGSTDGTVRLWDLVTGESRTLSTEGKDVWSVAFSPDGKTLVSGGPEGLLRFWDVTTGQQVKTIASETPEPYSIAFSPDGQRLACTGGDKIKLWNVATGALINSFAGHKSFVKSVTFSQKGEWLWSGSSDQTIKQWDVQNGQLVKSLGNHTTHILSVAVSRDGRKLASVNFDSSVKIWDVESRQITPLQRDAKAVSNILSVTFSPDGNLLATGHKDETDNDIKLWGAKSGALLNSLNGHTSWVHSVVYSPDGLWLASGSEDSTIRLWDPASAQEVRVFKGHSKAVKSVAFSPDGRILASGSDDGTIKFWNVATGEQIKTLSGHADVVSSVAFSPAGKQLASGSFDKSVRLWDVSDPVNAVLVKTLAGHADKVNSVAFSSDGALLASAGADRIAKLWDVASGNSTLLAGHAKEISGLAFIPGKDLLLTGSWDATMMLWRTNSDKPLATLVSLDKDDWAVVDPAGRFDMSRGGETLMHFVVGLEPIALEQLKTRYYDPKLLAKLLGLSKDSLLAASNFEDPKLYPYVQTLLPEKGSSILKITLQNRGGGIGRVQVFVNGKEFLADARDEKLKRDPNVERATLSVDLSKANGIMSGEKNGVRVVAWNVEDFISSRGSDKVWVAEGQLDRSQLEVYAILGGISTYADESLNLNFAAKDAVDMANGIELAAKRLFGADKVHLSLLSTAADPRATAPTKANFVKAFEAARRARPIDILIVYLAGHGITLKSGSDLYCFLTEEARTRKVSELSDPAVRRQQTITSEELVEWIKRIPANKQVIVLDTCAAGAAQAQLELIAKRGDSGDAIRAIDQARDRTSSYVLMGSAADQVAYEATQFGQGLLTYALLKGMKGPALVNDEFVDVERLFQYARNEVENLVKEVNGGPQQPVVFPGKGGSFSVGQLTIDDRGRIVLASPKPLIVKPFFFKEGGTSDSLNLIKALRAQLRNDGAVASRGPDTTALVFVDTDEFPGAFRPTGHYKIDRSVVVVTLQVMRDEKDFGQPRIVKGTIDDVPDLAAKVLAAVKEIVKKPGSG